MKIWKQQANQHTEANTAKYKNKTSEYLETYKSKYRNSHQGLFSLKHIYTSIQYIIFVWMILNVELT